MHWLDCTDYLAANAASRQSGLAFPPVKNPGQIGEFGCHGPDNQTLQMFLWRTAKGAFPSLAGGACCGGPDKNMYRLAW